MDKFLLLSMGHTFDIVFHIHESTVTKDMVHAARGIPICMVDSELFISLSIRFHKMAINSRLSAYFLFYDALRSHNHHRQQKPCIGGVTPRDYEQ